MTDSFANPSIMGAYILQPTGYRAFIPAELPPKPSLKLEDDLLMLLSDADRAIGRLDAATKGIASDVTEVVNYVAALNYGLERLHTLPLSLRLIREIHGKLLDDTRGSRLEPGEFRRSQNWIGPSGSNLTSASFIPPPP